MKSIFKWGFFFVVGTGVLALVGYLLVAYGVIRLNYPSKVIYPIQGIDVSHHQGDIDWEKVASEDWSFVIMKATEGGDWRDTKFQKNYLEAQGAGMVVGVYHYYSFCTPPVDQAQHFISEVGSLVGKLPPAVDLEFDKNCNKAISVSDFRGDFIVFVEELVEEYGVFPVVYCNEEFYFKYLDVSEFDECKFWIRNVVSQPDLSQRNWVFWQYTAKGGVAGINGPVDLNVFNGRRFEFEELILH